MLGNTVGKWLHNTVRSLCDPLGALVLIRYRVQPGRGLQVVPVRQQWGGARLINDDIPPIFLNEPRQVATLATRWLPLLTCAFLGN